MNTLAYLSTEEFIVGNMASTSEVSSRTSANCRMDTLTHAGAVLGTSDLRHSGTVPNAGRISGCYRPNRFYESLPESSYNPIKLIMFCYLLIK